MDVDLTHRAEAEPRPLRAVARTPAPPQLVNIERLIQAMEMRGIDGVVALTGSNQYYMSSFGPHHSIPEADGMFPVIFSRHHPDHPILLMAEIDLARTVLQPTWIRDVRAYATSVVRPGTTPTRAILHRYVPDAVLDGGGWSPTGGQRYYPAMSAGLVEALHDLGLKTGKVAVDNFGVAMSLKGVAPEVDFVPGEGLFRFARMGKTTAEIDLLRKAASINEQALQRTVDQWRPGSSFADVVLAYQMETLKLGGSPNLPDTMAMSNHPGVAFCSELEVVDYPINLGQNIIFDCHGKYNGYCWDGGKTWAVGGEPKPEVKAAWKATFAAAFEIQEIARPGVKISQLIDKGLQTFTKHGLNADGVDIFFHGLGLDHLDQEAKMGVKDWEVCKDMVISTHIFYPGDETQRVFLEEIIAVHPNGAERLFTWDEAMF